VGRNGNRNGMEWKWTWKWTEILFVSSLLGLMSVIELVGCVAESKRGKPLKFV